jgi:hypothetical protein
MLTLSGRQTLAEIPHGLLAGPDAALAMAAVHVGPVAFIGADHVPEAEPTRYRVVRIAKRQTLRNLDLPQRLISTCRGMRLGSR